MNNKILPRKFLFVFPLLIILILLIVPTKSVIAGDCACNYKRCFLNVAYCSSYSNGDYALEQRTYTNKGSCVDTSSCYNSYSGVNQACGTCQWGYGDDAGSTFSVSCVPTCSVSGGGSCDKAGPNPYSCDPSVTDNLILRYWQDNNQYDPNNPNSKSANHQVYSDRITFRGAPAAFCSTWYTEQFTGYIWIDGSKEFKLYTDMDSAVNNKPDSSHCCPGSASNCGKCEKRWSLASGCGSKHNLNRCVNTLGCQWVVWNQSRCSDDYSANTGLKIGYTYDAAKGKNVPAGEITDTGNPTGLSTVIRSGTGANIATKRFDGNGRQFEPGWYPVQAWYTRSNGDDAGWSIARAGGVRIPNVGFPIERSDNEYFYLQWRDPSAAGSFVTVPSTAFVPCLGGVVCGSNPGAATPPISPSDGEADVSLPTTLSWTAPSDWGETCGGPDNRYTVYAQLKGGAACSDPGPSDYSPLAECTDLPDTTTSCTPSFFGLRNQEYCWYVETNNGEFSTLSATSGSEVWEFKTEDPVTNQQWVTALYGDFYAGSIDMQFPGTASYVAPWNPPYLTYESGVKVPALASGDIDIVTDNLDVNYFPESQSQFFVKHANFARAWPPNYKGDPPSNATELNSDCDQIFTSGNLDPGVTYKANASCLNTAIVDAAGGNYQLDSDGVVTMYVTGSNDLRFDNEFQSGSVDQRVVFVTGSNVDVKIARSLNSGNPTLASISLIEAAFVINKSIEFEGVPVGTDPETDPDTSVVVEGPIITKNALFERNRALTNFYPSEIIKYNGDYIYKLTKQELDSNEGNYSGLFVIDVDWISEE